MNRQVLVLKVPPGGEAPSLVRPAEIALAEAVDVGDGLKVGDGMSVGEDGGREHEGLALTVGDPEARGLRGLPPGWHGGVTLLPTDPPYGTGGGPSPG